MSSNGSSFTSQSSPAVSSRYVPALGLEKLPQLTDAAYSVYKMMSHQMDWPKLRWSKYPVDEAAVHFKNHGHEFQNLVGPYRATDARTYAEIAIRFMRSGRSDSPTLFTRRQADGRIVRYDREQNLMGVLDRDRTHVLTFFRPAMGAKQAAYLQLGPWAAGEAYVVKGLSWTLEARADASLYKSRKRSASARASAQTLR